MNTTPSPRPFIHWVIKGCCSAILWLLWSCGTTTEQPPTTTEEVPPPVIAQTDSPAIAQPPPPDTPPTVRTFSYHPSQNSPQLQALLQQPLDLVAFKKAFRSANSGSCTTHPFFWRPSFGGFYFRYFVFRGCQPYGLQVVVYKKGKDWGSYSDTDETLIGLESSCEIEALGKLNLKGESLTAFEATYGRNYLLKEDVAIYAHDGQVLLLQHGPAPKHIIRKIKYLRTKLAIRSLDDLPEALFEGF